MIEDWSTDEDIDDFDSEDDDEDDYEDYEDDEELRAASNKSDAQIMDPEMKKRLKNAKKKAEKRRKMKEKKQKEKVAPSQKTEETIDSMKAHEEALR